MKSHHVVEIKSRIEKKDFHVGVIGLGYVGLPLLLRFVEAGLKATGFDNDEAKIKSLLSSSSYIDTVSQDAVVQALSAGMHVTADMSLIQNLDAIIICLPTPLGIHNEPDLSYIVNTLDGISKYLQPHQLLSLESTTYPGTTEEVVLPVLEGVGLADGENYYVVYSPEREDPGNPNYSTKSIPKVIGADNPRSLEVGMSLYKSAITNMVPVSSTKVAEMTKILENIHRAVNIGLVNEMKLVCLQMGIDIYEVIQAASTKPFGFQPYYPGPGLGGHCIPIDPFYLTWKAKEYGLSTKFIELAGQINTAMPEWVVSRLMNALNENGLSVKGSKILALGAAYKKNVADTRESPALEIMHNLERLGASVDYTDPHVAYLVGTRRYPKKRMGVNLTSTLLRHYDAAILITDHDAFDYDFLLKHSKLIVDTRGRFDRAHSKVWLA